MDAAKHIGDEYTVDDIYALPDGQRAELIDGVWFDMGAPSSTHQRISMEISAELRNFIRDNNGDCQVFPAPFAVFLKEDGKNYLEPDISVICDRSIVDEKGCHGAPDLIVEIVSPSTKSKDMGIKLFRYRMLGVKEYWVVDPKLQITTVYWFGPIVAETEEVNQFTFDEPIESHLYPKLSITLAGLL